MGISIFKYLEKIKTSECSGGGVVIVVGRSSVFRIDLIICPIFIWKLLSRGWIINHDVLGIDGICDSTDGDTIKEAK